MSTRRISKSTGQRDVIADMGRAPSGLHPLVGGELDQAFGIGITGPEGFEQLPERKRTAAASAAKASAKAAHKRRKNELKAQGLTNAEIGQEIAMEESRLTLEGDPEPYDPRQVRRWSQKPAR